MEGKVPNAPHRPCQRLVKVLQFLLTTEWKGKKTSKLRAAMSCVYRSRSISKPLNMKAIVGGLDLRGPEVSY